MYVLLYRFGRGGTAREIIKQEGDEGEKWGISTKYGEDQETKLC